MHTTWPAPTMLAAAAAHIRHDGDDDDNVSVMTEPTYIPTDLEHRVQTHMRAFHQFIQRAHLLAKPHQESGVAWCLANELRDDAPTGCRGGILADDMGLGKTIQLIGLMVAHMLPRTLVVVPLALLEQWRAQIQRTTGYTPFVFHGHTARTRHDRTEQTQWMRSRVVLTTYGCVTRTATRRYSKLHQLRWSRVVLDEGHHLKNANTMVHQSVRDLRADIRWIVTGTPIQNSLRDFHGLCAVLHIPRAVFADPANIPLIRHNHMLRRTMDQVNIQLGGLHVQHVLVSWSDLGEQSLSEEVHAALKFSRVDATPFLDTRGHVLSDIRSGGTFLALQCARQSCIYPKMLEPMLRKSIRAQPGHDSFEGRRALERYGTAAACTSKLDRVVQLMAERRANRCGKIVFCHYRAEMDILGAKLRLAGFTDVVLYDGRNTTRQRAAALQVPHEALLIQMQAGCEGLNLQEHYSEVYLVSPFMNPCLEDQAIGRCYRMGQTRPVFVFKFIMSAGAATGSSPTMTVEEYIVQMQGAKRDTIQTVMDTSGDRTVVETPIAFAIPMLSSPATSPRSRGSALSIATSVESSSSASSSPMEPAAAQSLRAALPSPARIGAPAARPPRRPQKRPAGDDDGDHSSTDSEDDDAAPPVPPPAKRPRPAAAPVAAGIQRPSPHIPFWQRVAVAAAAPPPHSF